MAPARILIVDDEPLNVDYLEQELEGGNHEILKAADGQQALEIVQSTPPDLILLDIMMPVLDGFQVLTQLKSDPSTRSIPVIIISAAGDIRNIVRGLKLGAEDFLPKPFEPTILHARVSSSLETKRLYDLEQMYLKGLEHEFDIARDIQQSFLPAALPEIPGWEVAAYFKAAREVAGDFYDAFPLPDGTLICLVGDVCGKGVGAALFMTLFRSLLRASFTAGGISVSGDSLDVALTERLRRAVSFVSDYVAETHADAAMFATLFACALHPGDGRMVYVNCGNEAALLRDGQGTISALGPTGPAAGVIDGAAYKVRELTLAPNSLLLAFTDGITDAMDPSGASYGRERLHRLLSADSSTPRALLDGIQSDLSTFVSSAEQFDDITLMAIRRTT
jgi:sigma-B regulation protein RsbU (phosphoserine phosphatase)